MPVRTLLLTDLVDSTALAERLGAHAAAALGARHDRLARDLLAATGGREIDKTDGFLLLFEDAAEAADYALAYHRALPALGLTARAGLHTDEVILRENPPGDILRGAKPLEVEGVAKAVAARVMSLAVAGQTLATPQAIAALGLGADPAPSGKVAVSHGYWRLKGVAEPLELFEVAASRDRPFPPPPDAAKAWRVVQQGAAWAPVREMRFSLPAERDSFIGRDADLQVLAERLDTDARLLSLLGIGGTGKTRLALHFAWTWLGNWPGGAWFCDLAEARDAAGIVQAVARTLDVPLSGGDPADQLGRVIAGRGKCLIVLDNFEQVARFAGETLGRWLDRAADAQFLVTTREVLGLPGETTHALPPLGPDDGVSLFLARARQAGRDLAGDPSALPDIRALVHLLDGLPLCVELAAARVRVMAPKTLLERMSQRFKLLASTGGRHTRHATLRAALDWSWDLLSPDEQRALAQLSVFEGGFTLEAAESVLVLDTTWVVDAIQSLVDKSLVRPVEHDRFTLLVSVQEYALEKLETAGGRAATETRHGAAFAACGAPAVVDQIERRGAEGLTFAADFDNILVACRRATARGDAEVAVPTACAALAVLEWRGPDGVAVALAGGVASLPGLSAADQAIAYRWYGRTLAGAGRITETMVAYDQAYEAAASVQDVAAMAWMCAHRGALRSDRGQRDAAVADYERGLALARQGGHRRVEATLLSHLAALRNLLGDSEQVASLLEQALALSREADDRRLEARVLGNLGKLHRDRGSAQASSYLHAALDVARAVGDRRLQGVVEGNLGNHERDRGRLSAAAEHFSRAFALAREVGDLRLEVAARGSLGLIQVDRGQYDLALPQLQACLALYREAGLRQSEGVMFGQFATVMLDRGEPAAARPHLEQALAIHREVNFPYGQGYWLAGLARVAAAEGSAWQALADEAVAIAAPFPVVYATALATRARLRLAEGDVDGAEHDVTAARARSSTGRLGAELAFAAALVALARREPARARAACDEARRLADDAGLGPASVVARELAAVEHLVGSFS